MIDSPPVFHPDGAARSAEIAMNDGSAGNLEGKVVAVIDDDVAVCESTRLLLEVHDIAVEAYLSGADFLAKKPDVACLIVDYQMPGLSGLELVAEARKRGVAAPAIMITAAADSTVERRAAELGVRQVLRKPLGMQTLIGALRQELA